MRFNFDDVPPSLLVSEYALGSTWFTQAIYAQSFFLTNTFFQDDCTPQANIATTFTNLVKNCAATKATVTATGEWTPLRLRPKTETVLRFFAYSTTSHPWISYHI